MLLCIKHKKRMKQIFRENNNTYGILSVFLEQSCIHFKCWVNQSRIELFLSIHLRRVRTHFCTDLFYRNTFF